MMDLTVGVSSQVPASDASGNSAAGRQAAPALQTHKALFSIAKGARGAHKYSVSGVFWYPVDTGLFVTGSFDHDVKVCNGVTCLPFVLG